MCNLAELECNIKKLKRNIRQANLHCVKGDELKSRIAEFERQLDCLSSELKEATKKHNDEKQTIEDLECSIKKLSCKLENRKNRTEEIDKTIEDDYILKGIKHGPLGQGSRGLNNYMVTLFGCGDFLTEKDSLNYCTETFIAYLCRLRRSRAYHEMAEPFTENKKILFARWANYYHNTHSENLDVKSLAEAIIKCMKLR